MYCLAYRLEGPDGDLTFSGDSEAVDAVAELADGSAVFVHDCSFPDAVDVDNHPTPSQLGATLAGRDYGVVYLSHLYPHTDGEHEGMLASLGERYDGEVRFARDGLAVTVSHDALDDAGEASDGNEATGDDAPDGSGSGVAEGEEASDGDAEDGSATDR
jgi:hypothetical protein